MSCFFYTKSLNYFSDKNPWDDYTLFDFLKILKINKDEYNGIDIIENGHYEKFLGHINAFNRLLDHLYCEECDNILYPLKSSHFALYRNTRFHCVNNNCSKKHEEIYLNSCLYGECKTIIDSRESKYCTNGMYICPNCGSCCSNEIFKRRLRSLEEVGGCIHPSLIDKVENNRGHLENKNYYCYKCSGSMQQIDFYNNIFECQNCNVQYNLSKFKWIEKKWTNVKNFLDDEY